MDREAVSNGTRRHNEAADFQTADFDLPVATRVTPRTPAAILAATKSTRDRTNRAAMRPLIENTRAARSQETRHDR